MDQYVNVTIPYRALPQSSLRTWKKGQRLDDMMVTDSDPIGRI